MKILQFFIVAIIGLTLDLAITWSIKSTLNFPLWLSAIFGFCVAAIANFILNGLWTFRSQTVRLSFEHVIRYCAALLITLFTRILFITVLTKILGSTYEFYVLLLSTGISFFFNFLLSKKFVYFSSRS